MEQGPLAQQKQQSQYVRSISKDIIFTILTCGLFNIYIQAKQMKAVNAMLNQQKYIFWKWLVLTIITCAIYHIYHEYRMSEDIAKVSGSVDKNDAIISLVLAFLGFTFVVDMIQQSRINAYFGSDKI